MATVPRKLSKSVLEMKFMKRTKEKVQKEEEAAESRALYASEITDRMLHNNRNVIIEPSYAVCEDLIREGRFSYRGMNKEIERLLEHEEEQKRAQALKEEQERQKHMKKDVSDEDMMHYYSSLVQTLGGKFGGKKRKRTTVAAGAEDDESVLHETAGRTNTKRKFIKPAEDD